MSDANPPLAPRPVPPSLPRLPAMTGAAAAAPRTETLADAIVFIDAHPDWNDAGKSMLKTCVCGIGQAVSLIRARRSNHPFDRRQLDLARIPFDLPAINRDLEGQTYRRAGFSTAKSFADARWGFRWVCREMGKITSGHNPCLPPDSPGQRSATAARRMKSLRHVLRIYVSLGHDPQPIRGVHDLLTPEVFRDILQVMWDRGRPARRPTRPEAERDQDETGNTPAST